MKTRLFILLLFTPVLLFAQQQPVDTTTAQWTFSAAAFYYLVPNDNNTVTAIGYADYKSLHMEVRYNYEDLRTVSVFAGRRFELGCKFEVGITPMAGFLIGNTDGFAPALELDATMGRFDLYSENEYVIDFAGSENNYFYNWSELAFRATEKLRTGVSIQRTKLYHSDWDLHPGIFAVYRFRKISANTYYFNPFTDNYYFILSLAVDF